MVFKTQFYWPQFIIVVGFYNLYSFYTYNSYVGYTYDGTVYKDINFLSNYFFFRFLTLMWIIWMALNHKIKKYDRFLNDDGMILQEKNHILSTWQLKNFPTQQPNISTNNIYAYIWKITQYSIINFSEWVFRKNKFVVNKL